MIISLSSRGSSFDEENSKQLYDWITLLHKGKRLNKKEGKNTIRSMMGKPYHICLYKFDTVQESEQFNKWLNESIDEYNTWLEKQ